MAAAAAPSAPASQAAVPALRTAAADGVAGVAAPDGAPPSASDEDGLGNQPQDEAAAGAAGPLAAAAYSHHHHQAAPAAPSRHPRPCGGGYMSAADLTRLDAYEPCAGGTADSAPSSLGGSRAGSECGDMPPTPPPGVLAATAARALSRLGAAPPSRPDSAASFSSGPWAPPPMPGDVVAFNWSKQSHRPTAEAALDTLVAAMSDDPINCYLLGGSPSARFARKEIKGYVKALPEAAHFIATRDCAAVALWQLLPQETPHNELLAGITRILRVPLRLWPALVALELRYEAAHARQAAEQPGESYYYLSFIGTAPAARGRGYASSLMRFITARADAEGRACLLEATSERSRSLYERLGFVSYDTYRVTPAAPPVFFMRREPQPFGGPPPRAGTPLAALPPPRAKIGCFGGHSRPKVAGAGPHKGALESGAASEVDTDDEGGLIGTAIVVAGSSGVQTAGGKYPESNGSGSNGSSGSGTTGGATSSLSDAGDATATLRASGAAASEVKAPVNAEPPENACED